MSGISRAYFALILLTAASAVACGPSEAADARPDPTSVRESIADGVRDNETTGVVGLVVEFPGHPFVGHCSGTLIAPNLVLTARHCVSLTSDTPDEDVTCGQSMFSTVGRGTLVLASPDTVRPTHADDPSFYRSASIEVLPGSSDLCGHDVALVVLSGKGMPASVATPIVPRVDSTPSVGDPFAAVGFGLSDPSDENSDRVRMRAASNTVRCAGTNCAALTDLVQPTEWLSTDAETCPGDSGGAALDAEGRVMGVTSRGGDGCKGAIFSDVGSFAAFIIAGAKSAAKAGGYTPAPWTNGSTDRSNDEDASTGPALGASSTLGAACSGPCAGGLVCYSDTGSPPGVCVPACHADDACPGGYTCSQAVGACAPDGSATETRHSGGCSVRRSKDLDFGALVALCALLEVGFARRRRTVRGGREAR